MFCFAISRFIALIAASLVMGTLIASVLLLCAKIWCQTVFTPDDLMRQSIVDELQLTPKKYFTVQSKQRQGCLRSSFAIRVSAPPCVHARKLQLTAFLI